MLILSRRRWLGSPTSSRTKARRTRIAVDQFEARQLLAVAIAGPVTLQLDPASATGPAGSVGVTSLAQPSFLGTATPGSAIDLEAFQSGVEVSIGTTTTGPAGTFSVTSVPLPAGTYQIRALSSLPGFTSPGGNPFTPESASDLQTLTVQTAAPRVALAQFEPLTGRVLVTITGDPAGINPAELTNPANYSFTPVATAKPGPAGNPSRPGAGVLLIPEYAVTGVSLTPITAPGQPQTLVVTINNNQPIRPGIYRFTINSAAIVDNAGNALDGEYSGVFPSGNGQPGGDFVAELAEIHNTVQPALPVAITTAPTPSQTKPATVFFPSTRAVRVRYVGNNNPRTRLLGGVNVSIVPLAKQDFPGTYRLPATTAVPAILPIRRPIKKLR